MTLTKQKTQSVVLSVACPKCKSVPFKYCVKVSGQSAETHIERMDAYNKRVRR